ncbi:mitochondrial C1- tetrahydrofolate synthase precursor [Brettanomyces nanus]|uniref:Mitochondrial C1- tetrahydrofolate synthase n=1 Tax=Eeniella nana TaxID=13502 RepID=A0A875S983_EENNA|nr:mitochondrial C1- tetrahydrofolate synthase precursor [Brettanomyces nanus]QPG75634.1 mitochondrial C1- tetrahydrofolate synthase precursor [Brettanomyces nanus]
MLSAIKCIARQKKVLKIAKAISAVSLASLRPENCRSTHFTTLTHSFSTSRCLNVAQVLSGKDVAKKIRVETQRQIVSFQKKFPGFSPVLAIIQVGSRPDSSAYVRMKKKASANSGIECRIIKLSEDTDEATLLNLVDRLNNEESVHGILVQLPLPPQIDDSKVTNSVVPEKDVDGFDRYNVGELAKRHGKPFMYPCTPYGCMRLLEETGVELAGKTAVVVGRSDIVGSPVAALLQKADCTVTVCHSHTKNLPEIVSRADILVVAIGQTQLVQGSWIKEGAIVIDVGMNYVPDSTKKSGHRAVGDVDYESAKQKASWITPVPGGVGPMTVAMLMNNVYRAAKEQYESSIAPAICRPMKLNRILPVPSDIAISRAQQPKPITVIAEELGVKSGEVEPYGSYKAKVSLKTLDRLQALRKNGYYVLVAGITPTPFGEGKSTTTIGLVQALGAHLGIPAIANVRQPSQGPTFGVKGGAAGGGYSQVIPMDEFNMHLTGDIHAVGAANNLLAAAIDARAFHESTQSDKSFYRRLVPKQKDGHREFTPSMLRRLTKLGINKTDPDDLTSEEVQRFARLDIDPDTITIKRVVDVNDRMLREITIGQSPTEKGFTRKTGFDITVASEIMAILALSRDLKDLRRRVGDIVVASSHQGEPITAEDIGAAGAITALLKDAIKPNLMQTLEGTPVFVHAGPFANISIGASSVIADRMALKLVGAPKVTTERGGFVVTEAGFDFTMGGERFLNIKCRASGLRPDVIVIVATVRALKLHGGAPNVKAGQPIPAEYNTENVELVRKGAATNLAKQISNAKTYGSPVVVAINKFTTDTEAEIEAVRAEATLAGAFTTAVSNHWEQGGEGAIELAQSVIRATREKPVSHGQPVSYLYHLDSSLEEKIRAIATKMYGAKDIELSELARKQIERYEKQGFGHLPVCIAKTQYSLSHDANLKGAPKGFTFPIREINISAGAGYLYALAGKIMTIPGLPTHSGFMNVEVEDGKIEGLF